MTCNSPYLSIVAVSRNDDHGVGLLQRMQHFIDCLSEEVNQARLPVELILVEWNPPTDRPFLYQALSWSDPSEFFTIRIITVPHEIHKTFANSENLSLFQMIGKNVGIRRARGRFVLATNIDIIFSEELIRFIAKKALVPGIFYRADRIDVEAHIPPEGDLDEKLAFCQTHIIRINSRYYLSSLSNIKSVFYDLVKNPAILAYYGKNFFYKLKIPRLHYNACGDFTLMAKKDWDALRGYPELEMFSLNIDSLFLIAAYFSGFEESAWRPPLVTYHIEHSIGSGISPGQGQRILFQRLERDRIPFLTWRDCVTLALKYKGQIKGPEKTVQYNKDSWGLAGYDLPEVTLSE
jgi:hypothetical protein